MGKDKRRIGRFEIVRLLGQGSQSAVYLAFDPHLEREVAIKTLHFGKADPVQNQILLAEARTVGKLRHAHIVPIYEAGEEDGDPYLVFEYVPGRTLADLMALEAPVAPHKALKLIMATLDALSHAHRSGVIHGDFKPTNILIDPEGIPRVMDFGISSWLQDAGDGHGILRGTPIYMAPEYVTRQEVGPKLDIYAAGLVLFELLFGRRAVLADGVAEALREVATRPVELPSVPELPDPLRAVLLKALAHDPVWRYASAGEMRVDLEAYLKSLSLPAEPVGGDKAGNATLEFLLRHMRHKSDFPALSDAVGTINRLACSDRESLGSLSSAILKDFALTNKILRVVNSPNYRAAAGGAISTVSRAIVVLGFHTIRSVAVSLLLFEHLQNKAHAASLKEEFVRVNLCALIAKGVAGHALPRDTEEAFICALFHNLGRLLTQYYFPDEALAVQQLMAAEACGEESASARVLGISFQDLGIGIARHWGFPESLVYGMRRPPSGKLPATATREDKLRAMSAFACEVCDHIEHCPEERRARELPKLIARFGEPLGMDERKLQAVLERVRGDIQEFCEIVHVDLGQTRVGKRLLSIVEDELPVPVAAGSVEATLLQAGPVEAVGAFDPAPPSGRTMQAIDVQAVLTSGIQDISDSLVEGFLLDDVLRIVLETMYRAMGFARVLLCLRDGRSNTMNGRLGFGEGVDELVRGFRFRIGVPGDVFNLALSRGADILISDASAPKIVPSIPEWYRRQVSAPTFLLFPMLVRGVPVALIYADKARAGSIAPSEGELALLRTLRNQAVLAIMQRGVEPRRGSGSDG